MTDDGPAETSLAVWADSVCASLSGWRSSITSLADVSGGTLTPESLREKLDEGQAATSELVVRLRELGPLGVANGDEVEQALDDAAAGLEGSYESLQAAASDGLRPRTRTTSSARSRCSATTSRHFSRRCRTWSRRCNRPRSSGRPQPSSSRLSPRRTPASSCVQRVKNARIRGEAL